jgi:hypothetical protein
VVRTDESGSYTLSAEPDRPAAAELVAPYFVALEQSTGAEIRQRQGLGKNARIASYPSPAASGLYAIVGF